jgi:hypothetical protein
MDLHAIFKSERRTIPNSSRLAGRASLRRAKTAWVEVVWGAAATKIQNCLWRAPWMVNGPKGVSMRAAGPMYLTARQCLQIAIVYEKAAADAMNVPRQQRSAFTRKARWFHMLARIKAAKEAALACKPPASHGVGFDRQTAQGPVWAPRPKYQTLQERLLSARTRAGP